MGLEEKAEKIFLSKFGYIMNRWDFANNFQDTLKPDVSDVVQEKNYEETANIGSDDSLSYQLSDFVSQL